MVIVNFSEENMYPDYYPEIWQYDYGQILRIQGLNLPPAVEIHFALQKTGGTSKNRIGITKDGVTDVPIPDSMLENEDETKDYDIYAFIYITDETSGQTEYRIALKVKARPKPEIPGGGDNPDIFHEAVEAVSKAMEAAAESERRAEGWAHGREDLPERAEDNAKYYAGKAHEDAEQTTTDRKEVERLVESVSGIEEQVEKVDGLTKQAQKAATDAGLYKEAAENARKGAETAKTEAETAAGKTAEDKAAVETARGEVLKAQEAVSTDRKAVESIKSGIEQLGGEITGAVGQGMQELGAAKQQAVQAIEQTGTAQKSAVEASGKKAVQSIENIKQTATEAVETAKSEAIQAVQTEGTTQAGNVSIEGEKQVQAVRGAAQEIMADREQIQENKTGIAKLKEDIANIYGWKEITPIEVVEGKLIQLDTKDEYEAPNSCYAKTEISNGVKKIKVSGRSASAQYGYGLAAFYDLNLQYISSIASEDSTEYVDKEVTVPNSAKYIIVNFNNMKEKVKNVSAFMAMPVADEIKKIDDLCNVNTIQIQKIDSNISKIQNKFEFDIEMNIHGILNTNPSDSTYIGYSDDENARCSDYIDCQNFKYISAKCNGSEWSWVIAFFNADKLFLPDISIVGVAGKLTYEVEIPESAKYVRISTYNPSISYFAKIMFSKNNIDADISDLQARVNALESPDDIYNGCEFALFKKWGLIGDSLSVGHTVSKDGETVSGRNIYYSWGQYLARRIGNTCLNFGRSGVTSKLWLNPSEQYCYPRLIDKANLCQAYIIALGANDTQAPLGSISDVNFTDMSLNADTEYGNYAKIIDTIQKTAPKAPIFLCTIPHPRNSDINIQAINNMIREFASELRFTGVYLVDLDAEYNEYYKTGKLGDEIRNTGWHLTSLGYLYDSFVRQRALSQVVADNCAEFQDVFLLPVGINNELD